MSDEEMVEIDWEPVALEWAAHRRTLRSMADLTDEEREEWSFIQAELEAIARNRAEDR